MRKHAWLIVVLLLLVPTAAFALATLTVSPDSVAFAARCVRTSAAERTVTVRNEGDRDATEVKVQVSPTSLASVFPLEGATAIPTLTESEAATFSVGFVPGKAGDQSAVARIDYRSVESSSPSPRATTVSLSGEGIDRFIDASPRALNFGDHRIGADAGPQVVTVYDDGASPLRITDISIVGRNAGDFTVRPRGERTITESSPLRLTVGFTPGGVGARSARLRIRSNACTDPVVAIDLAGSGVTQDIVALPAEIDFGVVEPGARATESVTIANQGGASLVVESIRLAGDAVASFRVVEVPTLPRTLSPGASLEFRIRLSAPETVPLPSGAPSPVDPGSPASGKIQAVLRVASTDGDSPVLQVPLRATIQEPSAVVSPTPGTSAAPSASPSQSPVGAGPSIADFGAEARIIVLVLGFFGLLVGVRKVRGAPD